jgi:hypothetical protein
LALMRKSRFSEDQIIACCPQRRSSRGRAASAA